MAELAGLIKSRGVVRGAFTRRAKIVELLLDDPAAELIDLKTSMDILREKYDNLVNDNQLIYDLMLSEGTKEEDLGKEVDSCDGYNETYTKLRYSLEKFEDALAITSVAASVDAASVAAASCLSTSNVKHRFKFPRFEWKTFDGNPKKWLSFWSQFEKVHLDTDLDPADKIIYLHQATETNSKARRLVESYPGIAANYPKIIEALEARFGRKELQVEIHIRELLKLVIQNSANQNSLDIASLYDNIVAHIRALETMDVTMDSCAAILFPMIESCLPTNLLKLWQRSEDFGSETDEDSAAVLKTRLTNLLKFLRKEVESEQRVQMAQEGLGIREKRVVEKQKFSPLPTASSLLQSSEGCAFCGKSHETMKCPDAGKLTDECKRAKLAREGRCFRCLNRGHMVKKCHAKLRCDICGRGHTAVMCRGIVENSNEGRGEATPPQLLSPALSSPSIVLQTLKVTVCNGQRTKRVRRLLYSGAQRSYILQSTAAELAFDPIGTETFAHALFGGQVTGEKRHPCFQVVLRQEKYACSLKLLGHSRICEATRPVCHGAWMSQLQKLGIQLTDVDESGPIEILLGADVMGKIMTKGRYELECGLVAIETLLGWTVMGKSPEDTPQDRSSTFLVHSLLSKDHELCNLWNLDVLGIEDPSRQMTKSEAAQIIEKRFQETVTINEEGRFEVRLPWKDAPLQLPSYRGMAAARLRSTIRNLEKRDLFCAYGKVFSQWEEEGVIEVVTNEYVTVGLEHYLPHRPVIKEESTTKIRPVFDASAHEKGEPSLNDCLEKGLNLIELIPTILTRFRLFKVGVVADIRKAFLQISVSPNDRDALRFLWVNEEGQLVTYRHRRVVFGVNSSPFLLGATLKTHLNNCLSQTPCGTSRRIIECLLKSFYVDNFIASVGSLEEAMKVRKEAEEIMFLGKFDLRGWEFSGQSGNAESVPLLGMRWSTAADRLELSNNSILAHNDSNITKRLIMSIAHKIFDPMGFVCPVMLMPKLLLQKLWSGNIDWDDAIDAESRDHFIFWWKQIDHLKEVHIPRWIRKDEESSISLHTFCDASGDAYASATFARVEGKDGVEVNLLMAKARVAPSKRLTIPRLELMAATIGARLHNLIAKSIGEDVESHFWSDSSTVISWIQRSEEWAPFVGNRVKEIRNLTNVRNWRHIPGIHNPADLPSRGCTAERLVASRWWEGLDWMKLPYNKWPSAVPDLNEEEIVSEKKKSCVTILTTVQPEDLHLLYFSQLLKTIRMMAWILRFGNNAGMRPEKRYGELTANELEIATLRIWKVIQDAAFGDTNDSRLQGIALFRDDEGLLRVRSRVCQRDDLENFRFPIVLPGEDVVVKRMIFGEHVARCHFGVTGLLCILRERYWVLGARRAIRAVISRCVVCRKHSARHVEVPTIELPRDRVRDACPFEIIGVDFAGPVLLSSDGKAWICLFTCAVYRAVHLELTTSLSGAAFTQVLRRFIARRGRPTSIYSDNGTNFAAASKLFNEANWRQVASYSSASKINWKFNPPAAPWWGGFWERLVGSMKRHLRRVLGRASLTYEELTTVLCDCEDTMNNRPLTYMSADATDFMPLTPNTFLKTTPSEGVPECDEADRRFLSRRVKFLQHLRDCLRQRFRDEYLGQLQWQRRKVRQDAVSIGELVLIGADGAKRLDWPMGRVIELIPGGDGVCRVARVKTQKGMLLRPVQRLYKLECDVTKTNEESSPTVSESVSNDDSGDTMITTRDEEVITTRSGRSIRVPLRFKD